MAPPLGRFTHCPREIGTLGCWYSKICKPPGKQKKRQRRREAEAAPEESNHIMQLGVKRGAHPALLRIASPYRGR